jgi:hypothetical protein
MRRRRYFGRGGSPWKCGSRVPPVGASGPQPPPLELSARSPKASGLLAEQDTGRGARSWLTLLFRVGPDVIEFQPGTESAIGRYCRERTSRPRWRRQPSEVGVRQVAEVLNFHEETVLRDIRRGLLRGKRDGRNYIISGSEAERYINSRLAKAELLQEKKKPGRPRKRGRPRKTKGGPPPKRAPVVNTKLDHPAPG